MKRIEGRRRMAGGEGMGGGNPGAEPDNVEVIEIHHHYFHNRFGHMRAEECAFDSCLLLSGSQHCDRRWLTCCFCSQGVFLKMLHWKEIAPLTLCGTKTLLAGPALPCFPGQLSTSSTSKTRTGFLIFKWRKHTSSSTKFSDALKHLKS